MEFEIKNRKGFPLVPIGLGLVALGVVILIVGVLLGGRGGYLRWEDGRIVFHGANEYGSGTRHTVLGDEFTSVYVNMTAARVTVRPSWDGTASVGMRDVSVSMYVEDGVLRITREQARRGGFSLINFGWGGSPRLYIYLPQDELDTLDIRTTSGAVRIYNVVANTMDINASSGAVRITGSEADIARIRASSGSVRIYDTVTNTKSINVNSGAVRINGGATGVADIRASSGSIRGYGFNWHTLAAGANSGAIRFHDAMPAPGGTTNLHATSGSVRLYVASHPRYFSYEVSSTSGTIRVQGGRGTGRNNRITSAGGEHANHAITIHTTSGSSRLDFN
jgi:hypothetical protein